MEGNKMKRTFQPKKRQNSKEHGFFKRMKTRAGRNVLKARRAKGRKKLSAQNLGRIQMWPFLPYIVKMCNL